MAFKDLIVHQSDGAGSKRSLAAAIELARRNDAHLTGVYVLNYPPVPTFVQADVPPELIEQGYETMRKSAEERKTEFEETVRREGIRGEFRIMEGDAVEAVVLCARYCDLVITEQPDPDHPNSKDRIPEGTVMGAGRPVLVIPYAGPTDVAGKRVMIAWNGTREATRAVHDAMPFLTAAESVVVYSVNPDNDDHIAGADLALHLSRHGVNAEPKHVVAPDIEVEDALLSAISDLDIDLLVMGAYGHSRLRELILGGATRGVFQAMTCPVIMAH